MQDDSVTRRTRRGYALIAGLVLAAIVVFNVDVIEGWFSDHVQVVALVRETRGIRVGSPVWVAGIEVGRVTAIEFVDHPTAPVAVSLRLDGRARAAVRKASHAHTAKRRFIGQPTVRIGAGPGDSPAVESGDTLQPSDLPSIEELLEQGMAFPPTLDSLRLTLGRLQGLIEERSPGLDTLVDRLARATAEAETLRQGLETGSLGRWLDDPTLPRRIERLRAHTTALSDAVARLERKGDEDKLGPGLRSVAERAERLGVQLDRLQRTLNEGEGFVSRMQRDSALAVAVAEVTAQIDSLRAEGLDFVVRMFLP